MLQILSMDDGERPKLKMHAKMYSNIKDIFRSNKKLRCMHSTVNNGYFFKFFIVLSVYYYRELDPSLPSFPLPNLGFKGEISAQQILSDPELWANIRFLLFIP